MNMNVLFRKINLNFIQGAQEDVNICNHDSVTK